LLRTTSLAAVAAAAFALTVAAAPALAQDAAQPPQSDDFASALGRDSVTVGVAGVYLPDYEGSNNNRFTAAPAAIGVVKGFSFAVLGNRASVDLIPEKAGAEWDFQFGPVGVLNFNRSSNDSIDDPRVSRLPERNTAVELGGYAGIGKRGVITSAYDTLSFTLSYRHDVSNVHNGDTWQPTITYLTPLSTKAAVAFFGTAQHVQAAQSRAYFDVSPAESIATGLPAFQGRGGWKTYALGTAATYSLTGNLLHGIKIVAGGTYSRMLNSYSASPLTRIAGSRNQWLGAVGLAYTF
jgi:outer membrane protein